MGANPNFRIADPLGVGIEQRYAGGQVIAFHPSLQAELSVPAVGFLVVPRVNTLARREGVAKAAGRFSHPYSQLRVVAPNLGRVARQTGAVTRG